MEIFVIYISAFSSLISSAVSPVISMTDASSIPFVSIFLAKGMDEASVMDMTGLTAEEDYSEENVKNFWDNETNKGIWAD